MKRGYKDADAIESDSDFQTFKSRTGISKTPGGPSQIGGLL